MRPARSVLLALLCIAVVLSCAREEEETDEVIAPSPAGEEMELTDAGRERTRDPAPARTAEPAAAEPLPPLDPRDSAFASKRLSAPPHHPSDFVLGSLRPTGLSAADLGAWSTLRAFLRDATGGGPVEPDPGDESAPVAAAVPLETDPILEAAVDLLAELDAPLIRLARPERGLRDERHVRFRLIAEPRDGPRSALRGEAVLEMANGQWYIADIQVQWAQGNPGSFDPAAPWR